MSPASMLSPMGRAVLQEVTREVLVRHDGITRLLVRLQAEKDDVADLPGFDEIAAPYGSDMPDPSEGAP